MLITQNDPLLVITNDHISEDAAKIVAESNVYLLLKTDENISSYPDVVEIAQHRIGTVLYSIVKKVLTTTLAIYLHIVV